MDIKSLILEKIKKKGRIKASEIVKQTDFSRAYVNRFFQELRDEGKIVLIGKSNNAVYVLADKKELEKAKRDILEFSHVFENKNLTEESVLKTVKDETGIFVDLALNVVNMVEYSFLEMVNNAIEHSRAEKIKIIFDKKDDVVVFSVYDNGIGIFNNIREKFKLPDDLAAIQHLMKGKQTTDPKRHTGQGIFFTSKIADSFLIISSEKKLRFINASGIDDVFLEDAKAKVGTEVKFAVSVYSKKTVQKVFAEYADKDTFEFSKTKIMVKLAEVNKNLLSRSEARRIVMGLENFKEIILDFKGVETIGQGFADEIFRVWQNAHKDIKITWQNANENVDFFIKSV